MNNLRLLLLQVRDPGDPMAKHELECIARRFGQRNVEIRCVNALVGDPDPSWLDGCAGCVIGGSGDYSVHHPRSQSWVSKLRRLIDRLLKTRRPTFAICFGHQLVAYHLGSPVNTSDAHAELGTVAMTLTDAGRDDYVFGDLEPEFLAHTGHSDHVDAVPAGVDLLVTNERVSTQAFKVRDAPIYTTQFHPDMAGSEAVGRYLAYQATLDKALDDPYINGASQFKPGADAATVLLGRFVDDVTRQDPK
jgi:GMP synthase (glutamine-hydrolysing)